MVSPVVALSGAQLNERRATSDATTAATAAPRLLLVTNAPTPYRLPLFRELNHQLEERGVELLVAFGALGYARRKWRLDLDDCGFRYTVLRSHVIAWDKGGERSIFTYGGLSRLVRRFGPQVVLVSGFSLATCKIWMLSLLRSQRYLLWSGSTGVPTGMNGALRRRVRAVLARRASGAVAYGSEARDYLVSLGIPAEQVSIAINTVDVGFFADRTRLLRRPRSQGRRHVFTCVGYLNARKGIDRLVEIVRDLCQTRRDFVLEIVGDGDERERLASLVRDWGLTDVVHFFGYRQLDEIPEFFARSDAFILATARDIWGLSLVEAMAAGLPAIASTHAGATRDLIEDGVNGFAVDFSDTARVHQCMNWIMDNPDAAAEMGRRAGRFVAERVNLQTSAAGFVVAVARCLADAGAPLTELSNREPGP